MHTDPNILTKRSAKELRGHFSTGASPMFSSGSLTSLCFLANGYFKNFFHWNVNGLAMFVYLMSLHTQFI